MEGPLGEYTGYYTPASPKPIARPTAITHRNNAYFQGLLTGVPPTENHILKQLPFEASFLRQMRQRFPTVERVAVPPSGARSSTSYSPCDRALRARPAPQSWTR